MSTKSEIDRLGDRLRSEKLSEADLRELDNYRREFAPAYDHVIALLKNVANIEPSGRPAKSTPAIVEKLRRQSIRLTQMQDIAGCRIVVSDVLEQNRVVVLVQEIFQKVSIFDRRENPSFGYRAVHLVVTDFERAVEVQIRTEFQHLWAEMSEKMADVLDHQIKYGGGSNEVQFILSKSSETIGKIDVLERRLAAIVDESVTGASLLASSEAMVDRLRDFANLKQQLKATFHMADAVVQELSRSKNAIPD